MTWPSSELLREYRLGHADGDYREIAAGEGLKLLSKFRSRPKNGVSGGRTAGAIGRDEALLTLLPVGL